jgi:hypothetical protein
VPPAQVKLAQLVLPVPPDLKGQPVLEVFKDRKVFKDRPEPQAQREYQDQLVLKELQEYRALQEGLARKDLQEQLVLEALLDCLLLGQM